MKPGLQLNMAHAAEDVRRKSVQLAESAASSRSPASTSSPPSRRPPRLRRAPILDPVVCRRCSGGAHDARQLGTGIIILPQRNPACAREGVGEPRRGLERTPRSSIGVGYLKPSSTRSLASLRSQARASRTEDYLRAMLAI